jgi:hypothetical protein
MMRDPGQGNQTLPGEQVHCPERPMHEAAAMQQKIGLDQEALNDAGLIALLCQAGEEIEGHGESNQLNLLLRDSARELLKNRLLGIVEFLRRRFSPARVASEPVGELDKFKHDAVLAVTDGD